MDETSAEYLGLGHSETAIAMPSVDSYSGAAR
jgi:hypothetical protein